MEQDEDSVDIHSLKYAVYVRKSTDDEERQQRSIDDQIAECEDLAAKLKIRLVKPYYEDRGSAKTPDNKKRSDFYRLLDDLEAGKVDGVIAWHPDRLARNMVDGGKIFSHLDDGYIKDLKFVTHYFNNDASGKMLLGIQFTLSTYYSANLSTNVKRGFKRGLLEGKSSGAPKHGYIRSDDDGRYYPDGKNFDIIKGAWQKRIIGLGLREIVEWVNNEGYVRITKAKRTNNQREIKMSVQTLSTIFRDTFYYGLLHQKGKLINLKDLYDFEPVVDEPDFNEVQRLTRSKTSAVVINRRKTFYPLRGMVKCSYCGRTMSVGASRGGTGQRLLYYRCDNKQCERPKKSIRARVIFDFIYDLLAQDMSISEKDYSRYLSAMTKVADKRNDELETQILSKTGALKATKRRIADLSLKIIDYKKESTIWIQNNQRIETLEKERIETEQEISELKEKKKNPELEILSLENFLNLVKNLDSKVKTADEVGKDKISRLIFLNLVVDEKKVVDYHLTAAFSRLGNINKINAGRDDWT